MNRQGSKLIAVASLTLILTIASSLVVGCEPIAPIKVRNETNETLTIFINGDVEGDVMPSTEFKNKRVLANYSEYIIEAKNAQGDVVYSQKFTFEDMQKIRWKIVIPETKSR